MSSFSTSKNLVQNNNNKQLFIVTGIIGYQLSRWPTPLFFPSCNAILRVWAPGNSKFWIEIAGLLHSGGLQDKCLCHNNDSSVLLCFCSLLKGYLKWFCLSNFTLYRTPVHNAKHQNGCCHYSCWSCNFRTLKVTSLSPDLVIIFKELFFWKLITLNDNALKVIDFYSRPVSDDFDKTIYNNNCDHIKRYLCIT